MKLPEIPTEIEERKAWIDFLYDHPVVDDIDKGYHNLNIRPAYVNPETKMIDDDESKNTHSEIWIEGGPPYDMSFDQENWGTPPEGWNQFNRWMRSHDCRLDCSGDTLEEALLKFAALLKFYYHDDGSDRKVSFQHNGETMVGVFEWRFDEPDKNGCVKIFVEDKKEEYRVPLDKLTWI